MQRIEPRQRRPQQQHSSCSSSSSSSSSSITSTSTISTIATSPTTMARHTTMSLEEPDLPPLDIYRDDNDTNDNTNNDQKRNAVSCWSWFPLPGAQHSAILARPLSKEMRPMLNSMETSSSSSSLDAMERAQDSQFQPTTTKKRPLGRLRETLKQKSKPIDAGEYAAKREMTKWQERWNALTMLPPSLFCILYVFTSAWLSSDLIRQAREELPQPDDQDAIAMNSAGLTGWLNQQLGDEHGCLPPSSLWPAALPPLTVVAVLLGTCLHMPFSFLYHWTFAHKLDASVRVHHWSRRMDQSMIHFASAMFAYACSGSLDYFVACALFNLDCARRHFLPHFRPRSNQVRVGIAIAAYSLPLLRRGDLDKFVLFWIIVSVSMWLFSKYPIGGWSHAAFHLAIGCLAPLLFTIAVELPSAQPQLQLAAQCTVWQEARAAGALA